MSDPVNVRTPDPVCKAIRKIRKLLEQLHRVEIPLGNGQIEKPLKFFVVSALMTDHSVPGGYLSATDKRFKPPWSNTGPELDLVALAKKAPRDEVYSCPRFWIEFKSTFREEGSLSSVVSGALGRVRDCLTELRNSHEPEVLTNSQQGTSFWVQLLNCPAYVVHFLGSTPTRRAELPPEIQEKYNRLIRLNRNMTAVELKALYEFAVQDSGQVFDPIRVWDKPLIDAVVTKFDVRDGEIVEDSRLEAERVELTSA